MQEIAEFQCLARAATMITLFIVLFLVASRAQAELVPNCTLQPAVGQFDDGDAYVRTNLMCNGTSIMVDVSHNYAPETIKRTIYQLFYQCVNTSGEVISKGIVENSNKRFLKFSMPLNINLTFDEDASCLVWGCYEPDDTLDFIERQIHPIENSTCTIIVPTTEPPTVVTTDPPETIDTASPLMSSAPPLISSAPPLMSSSLHPTSSTSMTSLSPTSTLSVLVSAEDKIVPTTSMSSLSPTSTLSVLVSIEDEIIPTATPSPSTPNHNHNTMIIISVVVVVTFTVVLICVLVLVGVVLRMQQVLRKKHSMMRYYDYQEPIDPHFNPIDINSRVKSVVSIVSEFDILMPQTHPSDSTNNRQSQIFQEVNINSDTSSVTSIKDESSDTDTNEINQQGPPLTKKPASDQSTEQPPQTNGYVPSDYLTGRSNRGYITKHFKPSALHHQNIQWQPAGRHANTVQRELHYGNGQLSRFGTPLSMSSLSSGYVTDLSTPSSDYHKYLTSPDSGASMVTMKTNPPLNSNPYPVLYEGSSEEETNSVVYSIGESENDSVECEAVGGVTEQKFVENIVAECSLSLNPLHFEPINYDDLVDEQTTPSYVNTTPGAELYQT